MFVLTVCLTLLTIVLSLVFWHHFEKIELERSFENDKKNLSLINYSINANNETVRNFCVSQFYNTKLYSVANASVRDDGAVSEVTQNLSIVLSSNSLIDSAVIYNNKLGEYYAAQNGRAGGSVDPQISSLVSQKKRVSLLSPIPTIQGQEHAQNEGEYFTYFVYDGLDKEGRMDGALIVNARVSWLSEILERLKSEGGRLTIINRQCEIIAGSAEDSYFLSAYDAEYAAQIAAASEKSGIFVWNIEGEKRVVTHLVIPNTGWIIIDEKPYASVCGYLEELKSGMFLIITLFLLFSLLLAFGASNVFYKPFRKLLITVQRFNGTAAPAAPSRDDLLYIEHSFLAAANKLNDLEETSRAAQEKLKNSLLTSLLFGDCVDTSIPLFEDLNAEPFSTFLLILLKIEGFCGDGNEGFPSAVKGLFLEAVAPFFEKSEFVELRPEEAVAILRISKQHEWLADTVTDAMHFLQNQTANTLSVNLSFLISDEITDFSDLHKGYQQIKKLEKNRIFFSLPCILNAQIAARGLPGNPEGYPYVLEGKILSGLKLGNLEATRELFICFIKLISQGGYDEFMLFLMEFTISLSRTVKQIDEANLSGVDVDLYQVYLDADAANRLDQIISRYCQAFSAIIEKKRRNIDHKHNYIIRSIEETIRSCYSSEAITLKEFAFSFKLSPVYLGNLFKSITGKSVAAYINDVRLDKAKALLSDSDLSIRDIYQSVGFENESNFYKIFKKRFGVTPRQYKEGVRLKSMGESEGCLHR